MEDDISSNEQLTRELEELRRRIALYEASEARNKEIYTKLLFDSENYRSILEASPSGIMLFDRQGSCLETNNTGLSIMGYRGGDLRGKKLTEFFPEGLRPAIDGAVQRVLAGQLSSFEAVQEIQDGSGVVWGATLSPIHDKTGKVDRFVGIFSDITERKEAEEALRAAGQKYQSLIETTDTGFVIIDDTGRVMDANQTYAEMCGRRERADVIGRSVLDWTAPYDQERNAEEVRKCLDQGYVRNLEIDYITPTGKTTPVEINATVLWSGASCSILGLCRDITERKQADEVRRQSEERFRKIFEEGPIGMVISGKDYKLMKANKAFCTMLGYSEEELVGKGVERITFPEDKEISEKLSRQLLAGEIPSFRLKKRYLKKDGNIIWASMIATAMHAEEGKVIYGLGMIEDITERKQAEDKIREEEGKYRLLFESANDGIFIQDEIGFTDCNQKGADMYGLPKEEIIGRSPSEFAPERQPDGRLSSQVAGEMVRAALSGVPQVFEWQPVRADGSPFDVEVTLSRLELGGKMFLQAIVRDISERKRLEQAILRGQKLEAIGTLAGGIAHDFNNLLQGIFGYISLAKMFLDQKEKSLAMLEQAENALHQSVSLTTQLLTFSKGGKPVKKQISLLPLIENAAKFALSGSRSICQLDIQPGLWQVDADGGQLGQVIQNIVLNADHAMPEGGTIVISAKNVLKPDSKHPQLAKYNCVEISVQDSGIGIPEKYLQKIFDPYFTTKEKGSGLGLATSYSIIRNHGGIIDVTSELGKGATFFIYLPAIEVERQISETVTASSVVRKGRILVMDDESLVRSLAEELISAIGHEVDLAEHGEAAIEKYRVAMKSGKPFDIVILDLTVRGGMGGRETIEGLRVIDPGVKAIVSSGYSDDTVVADYEKYGFKARLTKPYKLDGLRDTLNALLS